MISVMMMMIMIIMIIVILLLDRCSSADDSFHVRSFVFVVVIVSVDLVRWFANWFIVTVTRRVENPFFTVNTNVNNTSSARSM